MGDRVLGVGSSAARGTLLSLDRFSLSFFGPAVGGECLRSLVARIRASILASRPMGDPAPKVAWNAVSL